MPDTAVALQPARIEAHVPHLRAFFRGETLEHDTPTLIVED